MIIANLVFFGMNAQALVKWSGRVRRKVEVLDYRSWGNDCP